ncbi:MAG: (d)CMP kinase [Candidatus Marinimicrobia bacterium]|jgi:cytidylate kinase|nr:(d)CMP kinase [Candidatus Neomarinimicrobiota bacterium]MBT5955183.1 (d)CMP kinase [Candidatus Neomarinimicrobiota bacterium]MBT6871257.1 (d)CMP kinase [Candidatus Neomarinimicrobiota bacterium]|tara:strand:+ start:222 stop:884 length:663 start_codon:yes stop_codon:yes gene_type:complete
MIIAIDGPAGSGKSTTAKKVAAQLNLMHLDTGAMYRAVALYILDQDIAESHLNNHNQMTQILDGIEIKISNETNNVFLNGKDVSIQIRENRVSDFVSEVSAISLVRERMVHLQREIAMGNNVVLEGRDIGTRVFPNADVKVYLNADVNERGQRRFKELVKQGEEITLDAVIRDIESRDLKDSSREHSPLEKAKDAIEIDTTKLSIDAQVNEIVSLIETNN